MAKPKSSTTRLGAERSALTVAQESAEGIVCAGQRVTQEGSSPSGTRMRGAISKSGGNASPAGECRIRRTLNGHAAGNGGNGQGEAPKLTLCRKTTGGQGVPTVRWNPKGMRRSTGP
jgi:hypothetical protein